MSDAVCGSLIGQGLTNLVPLKPIIGLKRKGSLF